MADDRSARVDQMTRKLVDEGRLIEAGWQAMRLLVVPPTASPVQLSEMRKAFFTGAQHMLVSILGFLDDDDEPTAADMARMDAVADELKAFEAELRAEVRRVNRGR